MCWYPYKGLPGKSKFYPVLDINVINPANNYNYLLPVLVDTGATRTAIPEIVLKEYLKQFPVKLKSVFDYDQKIHNKPLYVLNLTLKGFTFQFVEVFGISNQKYGLLGHDILKNFILHCDGPNQRFMIE